MASPLTCDQCEELLPGYLLSTLEAAEAAAVAEHLHTCDRCQASLATYETVIDHLAQAVPPHEPPPEVLQRLMAAVTTPSPAAVLAPSYWWSTWRPRWVFVLTAANVCLCLGLAWWTWQTGRAMSVLRGERLQLQQQLDLQRQALHLFTTPATRPVALRSDKAESRAQGTLLLHPEASHAVLIVQDLPPLPPERAYQLWLIWGDQQRDNGGVFRVDARGFGLVPITVPRPLATYRAVGITEEPAGGSPRPTSPRLIGGTL